MQECKLRKTSELRQQNWQSPEMQQIPVLRCQFAVSPSRSVLISQRRKLSATERYFELAPLLCDQIDSWNICCRTRRLEEG